MFRHIGGRAAIFAAERQALEHAKPDQDNRRRDAPARIARQHADEESRHAHDHDGDEEGVFTTDEIAEPAEKNRPERAHRKAGCEGKQCEDESGGRVDA
jgi:hypothetical protein